MYQSSATCGAAAAATAPKQFNTWLLLLRILKRGVGLAHILWFCVVENPKPWRHGYQFCGLVYVCTEVCTVRDSKATLLKRPAAGGQTKKPTIILKRPAAATTTLQAEKEDEKTIAAEDEEEQEEVDEEEHEGGEEEYQEEPDAEVEVDADASD